MVNSALRSKSRWTALGEDRLVAHNVLVAGGTILAGALGFAFQGLVSHRLRPTDYAAVFAAMTLLSLIALPASALTLLMARETSRDRAGGRVATSAALLRSGNRALLILGLIVGVVLTIAAPSLGAFLGVSALLIVALAVGIPPTLALPLLLGELQGQQRFLSFSLLMVGMALAKLVAAVVLGLAAGSIGVVLGVGLASTVAYGAAAILVRRKLGMRLAIGWFGPALRYLALLVPSTLALSVLLSADVLLVKHFFSSTVAGEYSAVAALGRAIFWGAAGIAAVLFPKVTFHESQGQSGARVIATSLILVTGGGITGLLILAFFANPIVTVFAGTAYTGGAAILPLYGLAMTLLGTASVLIATHQSRARAMFLLVLLPITLAEPLLIMAFHNTLVEVVWVVTLSMGLLVAGLAILAMRRPVPPLSEGAVLVVVPAEVSG